MVDQGDGDEVDPVASLATGHVPVRILGSDLIYSDTVTEYVAVYSYRLKSLGGVSTAV